MRTVQSEKQKRTNEVNSSSKHESEAKRRRSERKHAETDGEAARPKGVERIKRSMQRDVYVPEQQRSVSVERKTVSAPFGSLQLCTRCVRYRFFIFCPSFVLCFFFLSFFCLFCLLFFFLSSLRSASRCFALLPFPLSASFFLCSLHCILVAFFVCAPPHVRAFGRVVKAL